MHAKGKLIEGLAVPKNKKNPIPPLAVLNRDDRSYDYLKIKTDARLISYGVEGAANVFAEDIVNTPELLTFTAIGPDFSLPIETSMIGNYNVLNILAALSATIIGLGVPLEAAQEGIRQLKGVPGRMERISMGQDFLAVVDFAHTPFAIQSALEAARLLAPGRVIAVFGSAGLRDKHKRRMMAENSVQKADLTVLTAEDPRTESLDEILAEMAAGAHHMGAVEGEDFYRIPDRAEAIRFAVQQAQPGDIVLALGKGHEQSMCFVETEYPWDDRTAMRAALAERLGIEGPEMPFLPTSS